VCEGEGEGERTIEEFGSMYRKKKYNYKAV
jgi:hypothetical protein